jgi:hypothetical protein
VKNESKPIRQDKKADFRHFRQILKKIIAASSPAFSKPYLYFFALIFFTLTLPKIFAKSLKGEGERL